MGLRARVFQSSDSDPRARRPMLLMEPSTGDLAIPDNRSHRSGTAPPFRHQPVDGRTKDSAASSTERRLDHLP